MAIDVFTGDHLLFHASVAAGLLAFGDGLGDFPALFGDLVAKDAAALKANACSSSFLNARTRSTISLKLGRKAGFCRQHSLMIAANGVGMYLGNGGRLRSTPTAMTICIKL